jgi:hypothetical protein
VQNLSALRGLDVIGGAGVAAAIGDPSRFASEAPHRRHYQSRRPSRPQPRTFDVHPATIYRVIEG